MTGRVTRSEPCPDCADCPTCGRTRGSVAPVRRCARCGIEFRWQEGRGTNWHRSDSIYCSVKCALAQAQRAHRARQHAKQAS